MRVLHLTDPHLFADKKAGLRGTVTYDSLRAVLDHYEAGDWRADLVVATGDLVQDDSAQAYVHFRELLEPLGLPVHCVPGNHDVRALMKQALASPPFSYCDTVDIGNWLLVGIDSCVTDRAGGAILPGELDRLDGAIDASGAEHVMVCLHHPPVPMGSRWLDQVGLADAGDFLDAIQKSGRVRVAAFGHVHQDYDAEHNGIRLIATPSTCRQFLPTSDEFALDGRPPAYRRFELHRDGSVDDKLVWLNDA